uniref:Uncharacterized protein n=1 Tax=Rhizophora mucronata TaxID=61149 RepID=A0A2P2QTP2_RHIMU
MSKYNMLLLRIIMCIFTDFVGEVQAKENLGNQTLLFLCQTSGSHCL